MVAAATTGRTAAAAGARIEVQGVSHWFERGAAGPLQVLDEVDLTVAPGEFVALLGPID